MPLYLTRPDAPLPFVKWSRSLFGRLSKAEIDALLADPANGFVKADPKGPQRLLMDHYSGSLRKTDYDRLRGNVPDEFSGLGLVGAHPGVIIEWASLNALMDPIDRLSKDMQGLKFYFGLDASGALRFAFTKCAMVYVEGTEDTAGYFDLTEHTAEAWELKKQAGNSKYRPEKIAEWGTAGDPWPALNTRYYTTVEAKNRTPKKLEQSKDPNSTILPWDSELLELFYDTMAGEPAFDAAKADIVLTLVANAFDASDGGYAGMRLGVGFHMRYENLDRLDDRRNDPVVLFRFQAADLGNPCPPRCKKYTTPLAVAMMGLRTLSAESA